MVQIVNTIFVGWIVSSILKRDEQYQEKSFGNKIIIGVSCFLFFVIYGFITNMITIFGPGVLLSIVSYWDYYKGNHIVETMDD